MDEKKFNSISEALDTRFFESYTDGEATRKKKRENIEIAKRIVEEELVNRRISFDKDVIDVYPTCIKVEKETLDFPLFREAVDSARKRLQGEYGIAMELYSF